MILSAWEAWFAGLAGAVTILSLIWLWQLRSGNAGIVDAWWSFTTGALGVWFAAIGPAPEPLRWLVGIMSAVWGLRLGGYLLWRNAGKAEDRRYAELRRKWGSAAPLRMWGFFAFQALIAALLAITFAAVAWRPDMPGMSLIVLGIGLWVVAIVGEAVADWQLAAFLSDPANRGRVCDVGLWGWSRHPNYFFETMHWISYIPLAIAAPWGWASATGAVLIAVLLLKISGVPTVEGDSARKRHGFAEYRARTSAFIPWPPKAESSSKPGIPGNNL